MANANKFTGSNRSSIGIPDFYDRENSQGMRKLNGVFIAKVVDFADERYQQHIWVDIVGSEIISKKDTIEERHKFHKVRQMSPFGGTIQGDLGSNNYGATWTPPAPGTEVLVAFTGAEQEGFLLGVLPDINRNAMQGGYPASPDSLEGDVQSAYDHHVSKKHDGTRRKHPVSQGIAIQGLGLDAYRGHSSSGARRESPSRLSGFNSPGGHSLVLDDGTESYKKGTNFVPDKNRKDGDNNLIRLRSGRGAQILLNDSAGIVYIINQNGTGWVEIDPDGNIDVFSESNISMHAKESINFYAGDEFNVDAETINIRARGDGGIKMESTVDQIQLYAQDDMKLCTKSVMHLRAGPHMKATADLIDLNGPPATCATRPTVGSLAVNREVKESITNRVPEHEPWGGHAAQSDKIAAQAKSDPVDPDENDFSLGSSSGAKGGYRGGSNVRRDAQKEDEKERASIYSDQYIDQHIDRNSIDIQTTQGPQNGRGGRRGSRLGQIAQAPGQPNTVPDANLYYDRSPGLATIALVGEARTFEGNSNPRTRRGWKSDVMMEARDDLRRNV